MGRYGFKTILYFEIITTIAIGLGILFANIFKPGKGLDPDKLPKGDISTYESSAKAAESSTYGNHFIDTIVNIVPQNLFEALTSGELLPIIFFAVFLVLHYQQLVKGRTCKSGFKWFIRSCVLDD